MANKSNMITGESLQIYYTLYIFNMIYPSSPDTEHLTGMVKKAKIKILIIILIYKKTVLDIVQKTFKCIFDFSCFSPTEVHTSTHGKEIKYPQVLLWKWLRHCTNLRQYIFSNNFFEMVSPVKKKST